MVAPADDAIRFNETRFVTDFHSHNIYLHPPSSKVDDAWNKLYMGLCHHYLYANSYTQSFVADNIALQISGSEAQRMRNKPVPVPADSDDHLVSLMVFHQLHCLVSL